jgi:GDPmannose 4,6-dehydratase
VTQKIIQGVKAIVAGTQEKLRLGNLDIWRDWGWAPEYVEAMHRMLQANEPRDYLIATGQTSSLQEFVKLACAKAGLDTALHIEISADLMRPTDLKYSGVQPYRIKQDLDWSSQHSLADIVNKMYHGEYF